MVKEKQNTMTNRILVHSRSFEEHLFYPYEKDDIFCDLKLNKLLTNLTLYFMLEKTWSVLESDLLKLLSFPAIKMKVRQNEYCRNFDLCYEYGLFHYEQDDIMSATTLFKKTVEDSIEYSIEKGEASYQTFSFKNPPIFDICTIYKRFFYSEKEVRNTLIDRVNMWDFFDKESLKHIYHITV